MRPGQIEAGVADGTALVVYGTLTWTAGRTDGVDVPAGTAASAPTNLQPGAIRVQSDTGRLALWDGTSWGDVGLRRPEAAAGRKTTSTVNFGATPVRMPIDIVDSQPAWATVDTTNDQITLLEAGTYLVVASVVTGSGSANQSLGIDVAIYIDGIYSARYLDSCWQAGGSSTSNVGGVCSGSAAAVAVVSGITNVWSTASVVNWSPSGGFGQSATYNNCLRVVRLDR